MGPHWLLAVRPIMTRETIALEVADAALPPTIGLDLDPGALAAGAIGKIWPAASKWSTEDFFALGQVAADLGVPPADLLAVLYSESALDPAARYPKTGYIDAVGLNQITSVLDSALGITEAQRQAMVGWTVGQQLPYVRKSFLASGVKSYTIPDAGGLYVANFAPGRMAQGFGPGVVMYDAAKNPKEYTANKPLDRENKGYITLENMRQMLRGGVASAAFQAALARYSAATGDTTGPRIMDPAGNLVTLPGGPGGPAPATAGVANESDGGGSVLPVLAAVAVGAAFVAMRG